METFVGFVAGYLAGCREGKDGVARLRESWDAIRNSAEGRRMAGDAVSLAGAVLRRATSGRSISALGGTVETVTDMLAQRAQQRRAA
jgi:hypothetical protein